jgi:hypothetical protein
MSVPTIANLPTLFPTVFASGSLGSVKFLGAAANCGQTFARLLPDGSGIARIAHVSDGAGHYELIVTHTCTLAGATSNFQAPNAGVHVYQDSLGALRGDPHDP